jgi:chromosome segregation ATPase
LQGAIRRLEAEKRSKEREIAKEVKVLERRLGPRPESEMVDYVDPETNKGPKSVDTLKKLIRRLQKLIKSREKTYSRDEVMKMRARFEKLDKRYQAKKARFDIVNTRHGGLKAACTDRHDRWIGFREKASKKTAKYFKKLLQHRGSTGDLTFDHEEGKTLNMQLCMDVNQTEETILASQVTNTSALSGGERSSVTLALLMALGETIDCPFRLMDELDVYMDPANRQMLMDVIARAAERHFDRQVIMLTPNNIDGMLKVGDDDDDEATMRVLMPENLNILTLPSKKKRGN